MPFLDIGSMELFLVAVIALVVVGPKDLPRLMRSLNGYWQQVRGFAQDMRRGMDTLAREVEDASDPFADLRKQEGLKPGMTPEEITEKILNNRGIREPGEQDPDDGSASDKADGEANTDTGQGEASDGKNPDR